MSVFVRRFLLRPVRILTLQFMTLAIRAKLKPWSAADDQGRDLPSVDLPDRFPPVRVWLARLIVLDDAQCQIFACETAQMALFGFTRQNADAGAVSSGVMEAKQ